LFSNTPSLCFSLNVTDQISHPYRTTGKITVLYILIFKFFDSNREKRRFWTEWYNTIIPISVKVGTYFSDKWRSLCRYGSFTDSGHGVQFYIYWRTRTHRRFAVIWGLLPLFTVSLMYSWDLHTASC
jgi:hypothetical protein